MPDPDPTPTPTPSHPLDVTGLPTLTIPANTPPITAGQTVNFGSGQDEVTVSCPAGGADCTLTQAAGGAITSTGGRATAMLSTAAQGLRDTARMAMLADFAKAISRPKSDDTFDNMIDRNSPNRPMEEAGRPLKVDGDMVSEGTMKFTKSSTMPPSLTGFAGSIHTRTGKAATATDSQVTDSVTVYTNQMSPTPTPFSGTGGVYKLDVGGIDDSDTNPHTALDLTNITSDDLQKGKNGTTLQALVKINQHVPTAGTSTITFGKDAANTVKTLSGTFDGAMGTYECTTTCMIRIDTDGTMGDSNTITGGGDVSFVPASNATVPAPDTDYLTFGYWVQTSTKMNGDATTGIAPFVAGKMPYDNTTLTALTNLTGASATYEGPATGMFVHKTDVDGDGKGLVPTSSGQFTADASLTAHFGESPDVGTTFQNAINGTVSNFVNSSTNQAIEGWTLTLKPAKFDTSTEAGFDFGGMTSGGANTSAGGWRGNFYGPATGPDGPDDNTDPDVITPGSVAGEFLGHFSNGHVVGAFGATEKK